MNAHHRVHGGNYCSDARALVTIANFTFIIKKQLSRQLKYFRFFLLLILILTAKSPELYHFHQNSERRALLCTLTC
jgi:hypothetical protein